MAVATLQTILSRAARRCSYDPAQIEFFTGNDPSGTELLEYASDTAREIIERCDVAALSAVFYISGGADDAPTFSAIREDPDGNRVPLNIVRIPSEDNDLALNAYVERVWRDPNAVIETTGVRRRVLPVPNGGSWASLVAFGPSGAQRYYRTLGAGDFRLDFWQPLRAGAEVAVTVMTNRWLRRGGPLGGFARDVQDGDDVSIIPERLLELGIVAKFRERRGLDYNDVLSQFEAALARWDTDTKPRQMVSLARPARLDVNSLKPDAPDYIPFGG